MAKRVEEILERQLAYCKRWRRFIDDGFVTVRGGRGAKLAALEEINESIEIIEEALMRHRKSIKTNGKGLVKRMRQAGLIVIEQTDEP